MIHGYSANAIESKPSLSELQEGFPTNGDRTTALPPTMPGAAWFYMITEELMNVLRAAEIAGNKEKVDQVSTAIKSLIQTALESWDLSEYAKKDEENVFEQKNTFNVAPVYAGTDISSEQNDGVLATTKWINTYFSRLDKANTFNAATTFKQSPTAPTPTASDNTTKLATTAFVKTAINNIPEVDLSNCAKIATANTFTKANTFNTTTTFKVSPTAPTPTKTDNSTKLATTAFVQTLLTQNAGCPTGTILAFMGTTSQIPAGWLYCNGAYVSKTTYADLFAVIGTKFGASGNNFRLPILNDNRFLEGHSVAGTSKNAGLPNIMGSISQGVQAGGTDNGALYRSSTTITGVFASTEISQVALNFNASKSNSIYNSSTVQPKALTCIYLIKI